MDFNLTEDQKEIRDLADGLVRRRVSAYGMATPTDASWFDRELWAELARSGLLGIAVDEVFDGSGAGFLEQCLMVDVVARHAARVPLVETVVQGVLPIAQFGTDAQKSRHLPSFCTGDSIITSSASPAADTSHLSASRDGDDWRLNGHIDHLALGAQAATALVPAFTPDGEQGWFIIDLVAPSVSFDAQSSVDRIQHWRMTLVDHRLGDAAVLAAPGPNGTQVGDWIEKRSIATRCIAQAASADAALRMTADHVTQRHQFGTPVGSFQAVAHRVADAYIDATAMRLTAWRAAWLLAEGLPATEQLAVSAWWAADAGNRVAEASMHLHGGQSVDLDYPLHRYFLAIRHGELALGGPGRRLRALGDLMVVAS